MTCQNPECKNGLVPGLVMASPRGSKVPLIGSDGKMGSGGQRWGWVKCLACNASEESKDRGIVYKHVPRSPEEIAQRAARATNRETYKPESAVARGLGGVRAGAKAPEAPPPDNSAQLTKLLDQVTKLTEQITELLTENRDLRKELKEARDRKDVAA